MAERDTSLHILKIINGHDAQLSDGSVLRYAFSATENRTAEPTPKFVVKNRRPGHSTFEVVARRPGKLQ